MTSANNDSATKIEIIDIRPEVIEFAKFMEWILRKNDYKGGWSGCTYEYLLKRLCDEHKELRDCFWYPDGRSDFMAFDDMPRWAVKGAPAIFRETADVANIAMMIFDNLKRENGGETR